jgi:hypothetical protein
MPLLLLMKDVLGTDDAIPSEVNIHNHKVMP